jgi:hypothetical protein
MAHGLLLFQTEGHGRRLVMKRREERTMRGADTAWIDILTALVIQGSIALLVLLAA